MTKPTKIPISLFLITIALASIDSSKILDQLGPTTTRSGPQPQLLMGPISPIGPGPKPLSFFMHDILGGSHPSTRIVTKTISQTSETHPILPFSKPNKNILPLPNRVPLIMTRGETENKRNSVKFGSVTTIDDELTEGEELGSGVVGRAQGFYFSSSLDGTSQTIALTMMILQERDEVEGGTISLFGVRRTAAAASDIAVVGGTGMFEKARGYAVVESLRHRENQHVTDGVDTILHFSVYLSE